MNTIINETIVIVHDDVDNKPNTILEKSTEIVNVITEGPQGPPGRDGSGSGSGGGGFPIEVVSEFPISPVEGTLYIKVAS